MDRPRFLLTSLAGALAAPVAAEARQPTTSYRITIAHPSTSVAEMTESASPHYRALFSELRGLGYVEGQNLVVDRRTAEARTERCPEFAREVVRGRADLILASSSRLIQHFKTATTTIPIVGLTGDPIAAGIVGNLARPGGNITGFAATPGDEIYAKYVQLLTRPYLGPHASRFSVRGARGRGGTVA